jgi:microcystin-dependent protein
MDAYTGEIRMFAGNYAPQNWMLCDGSLLNITQYSPLYSLIGTIYGGNGSTNFALPDLRGRVPVHAGQLSGSSFNLGQSSGAEHVVLGQSNLPAHTHNMQGLNVAADANDPTNRVAANANIYAQNPDASTIAAFDSHTVQADGGTQNHENMMQFQVINYIICVNGEYPPRD